MAGRLSGCRCSFTKPTSPSPSPPSAATSSWADRPFSTPFSIPFSTPASSSPPSSATEATTGLVLSEAAPFRVLGTVNGSPAHLCGTIEEGHVLDAIDGVTVASLPFRLVREMLVGDPGTHVTVTFSLISKQRRSDEIGQYNVTLRRSVSSKRSSGGTGGISPWSAWSQRGPVQC
mmetsp:Transcript_25126/g.57339  ORF Transcript_25126/g.57339 Transcript_25126/m.57339 type:complete len:175 (-) Transcript_25126:151-675(-)